MKKVKWIVFTIIVIVIIGGISSFLLYYMNYKKEEKIKELQGNNKYNLVCVEVIAEEVKEDTTSSPEEITKSSPEDTAKGKTKNAKRK